MGKNTIQFQKGMSLKELGQKYGTDEQCYEELNKLRWPKGFECPKCGYGNGCLLEGRGLYECYRCGHQTSLTAGTIFHSTKLPLSTWFLGIYLVTQSKNGMSAMALARHLGISYNSAWRMKHKLMQVMLERDNTKKLSGDILIDDSCIGGERTGYKRGRGTRGKTPFIAAVEMKEDRPQRVKFSQVKRFSKAQLKKWSRRHLNPGSVVTSDGLQCFNGISDAQCEHIRVITGGGRKAAKHPVFQWLNTLMGNVKNSFSGTYHSFHPKHTPRYLAEFQYRINRRFDLEVLIPRFVYIAARTSPWPERLLVLPENQW